LGYKAKEKAVLGMGKTLNLFLLWERF